MGKPRLVLLPPHGDPDAFRTGKFGDYVLAIGRINRAKRQELLIEAMATVTKDMRLVIAGAPETPVDLTRLNDSIARFGVGRRVEVIPNRSPPLREGGIAFRGRAPSPTSHWMRIPTVRHVRGIPIGEARLDRNGTRLGARAGRSRGDWPCGRAVCNQHGPGY